MSKFIPKDNSVTLFHHKSNDGKETAMYPITMYNRIINAPHYTKNINTCYGAEFVLLENRTEEVTDKTLERMLGNARISY